MARNAGGTYSLPLGPVVTGTTILSTWANTTLNDLAPELTDSLSRSGKGGMQAPLGLMDGTVGAPGLAFNLELSSGLRRAGASDIRLVVAGVDRLQLASASVFTTTLPAADAGTGLLVNSSVTRTAGQLFRVSNNGSAVFTAYGDGHVGVNSLLAAAATGTDFDVNTANTRTAGLLLDVKNNTVSRFKVSPTLAAFVSGAAAADTTTDFLLNSTATRTAGLLLDVQNNTVSRFRVSPTLATFVSGAAAGDGTTDFLLNSTATRTAGLLLDVQNNAASKFSVGPTGITSIAGVLKALAGLQSDLAAGSTSTDFLHNTANTRTAGLLLDVQNNTVSKFSVGPTGFTQVLATGVTSGSLFRVMNNANERVEVDWRCALIQVQDAGVVGCSNGAQLAPSRFLIQSDVSCSSNTVAVNLGPAITARSGVTYRIRGHFLVSSAAGTTGLGINAKSTGAPTVSLARSILRHQLTATTCTELGVNNLQDTPSTTTDTLGGATGFQVDDYTLVCSTTSTGTLQLVLISEVNTSTVTVRAGSWFEVTED